MNPSKYLLAVPLLLVACTSLFMNSRDDTETTAAEVTTRACPLGMPSTRIRIADTKDGVDLFFSTTMSGVDELRTRVRNQSTANGPNRHVGAGHEGKHAGGHGHGLQLWSMGEVKTSVEETANGAKISIVPVDPARRDTVRKLVIERVALLESRGCHD